MLLYPFPIVLSAYVRGVGFKISFSSRRNLRIEKKPSKGSAKISLIRHLVGWNGFARNSFRDQLKSIGVARNSFRIQLKSIGLARNSFRNQLKSIGFARNSFRKSIGFARNSFRNQLKAIGFASKSFRNPLKSRGLQWIPLGFHCNSLALQGNHLVFNRNP